jgi:hypothetical protein
VKRVAVLTKAAADIEAGSSFYECQEPGLGAYFVRSILEDFSQAGESLNPRAAGVVGESLNPRTAGVVWGLTGAAVQGERASRPFSTRFSGGL